MLEDPRHLLDQFSSSNMLTHLSCGDTDNRFTVYQTWGNHRSEDSENVACEVTLYLQSPVGRLGDNPLEIWREIAGTYLVLAQIAPKYLSIVATSVPSKRLFSKAGIILSKLLFLQSLEKYYWDF
ncbi:hypothetical protein CBL_14183 [Carabus blaptoides fortunei]